MANTKECDINNVTSMSHIINYLNRLRKSGVGPITKLTTITNALRMVVSMVPNDGGDDETKDLVVRVKVVETKIKGITKSLRKECSVIRLEKREMFDGGTDMRHQVLAFLQVRDGPTHLYYTYFLFPNPRTRDSSASLMGTSRRRR